MSLAARPAGTATAPHASCPPPSFATSAWSRVWAVQPLGARQGGTRPGLPQPPLVRGKGFVHFGHGCDVNVTPTGGTTTIAPDNLVAPLTDAGPLPERTGGRFTGRHPLRDPRLGAGSGGHAARFTATMAVTINYSLQRAAPPIRLRAARFTTRPGSTSPISSVVEKGPTRFGCWSFRWVTPGSATPSSSMRGSGHHRWRDAGAGSHAAGTRWDWRSRLVVDLCWHPLCGDPDHRRHHHLPAQRQVLWYCCKLRRRRSQPIDFPTVVEHQQSQHPGRPRDWCRAGLAEPGWRSGCAEGMSKVGQPITWTRLVPDGTTPSQTGSTMAMEIAHTFGDVPLAATNADPYSRYHSKNTQADDTAPNRAYNVPTRQFWPPTAQCLRCVTPGMTRQRCWNRRTGPSRFAH